MSQTNFNCNNVSTIKITLRKFVTKKTSFQNQHVLIKFTADNISRENVTPRKIKDGVACFYGEAMELKTHQESIKIQIFCKRENRSKKLATFNLEVQQLTSRQNTFNFDSQLHSFVMMGSLAQEGTVMDEYIDELDDFAPIQFKPRQQNRQVYSPLVKGEIRRKRGSFRMGKDDTASQHISESPQKYTQQTIDTLIRFRKHNSRKGCDNIKIETNDISHPVFSPKKEKNQGHIQAIRKPMTPQSKRSPVIQKRRKQTLIDKINLKTFIYTSVVGIISGVTAAKMNSF